MKTGNQIGELTVVGSHIAGSCTLLQLEIIISRLELISRGWSSGLVLLQLIRAPGLVETEEAILLWRVLSWWSSHLWLIAQSWLRHLDIRAGWHHGSLRIWQLWL